MPRMPFNSSSLFDLPDFDRGLPIPPPPLASAHGEVRWDEKPNRDGHARASFRYINFNLIPAHCLIARSFSSIPF